MWCFRSCFYLYELDSISTSDSLDEFIAGQLIYEKLPQDISDRHVLLLDPILGTGSFLYHSFCIGFNSYARDLCGLYSNESGSMSKLVPLT